MSFSGSEHQSLSVIQALGQTLQAKLSQAQFVEAYTTSPEELIVLFADRTDTFSLKIITRYQSCFWIIGNSPLFKPANAQSIFEPLMRKPIQDILVHTGNRSFSFRFQKGFELVFKCYDGLTNVILFQEKNAIELFRKNIINDTRGQLNQYYSPSATSENEVTVATQYWISKQLNVPFPYIFTTTKPEGEIVHKGKDMLEGLTYFSKLVLPLAEYVELKQSLINALLSQEKKLQQTIKQIQIALTKKDTEITPSQLADIIMANLHAIPAKAETVQLFDFYAQKDILIKLKKDLSPQQFAAYLYRKSKNQQLALAQLQQKLELTQQKLIEVNQQKTQIEQAKNSKELKPFVQQKESVVDQFPFKRFVIQDFEIWVGKNATNNDLLTTRYAHKEDLWFHAKDVSGSHVVLKHISGKPFSIEAIEVAASIAAYYSKLKGSGLVSVLYTLKKYVRKPKGAAPGAVKVEKEKVILVEPKLPA